jgi:hypothetical protein
VENVGIVLSKPNHTTITEKSVAGYLCAGLLGCGIAIYETGGEGGILLPPLSASHDEPYTSLIIACVKAVYKPIQSSVPVSTVSLILPISLQNGITGISK